MGFTPVPLPWTNFLSKQVFRTRNLPVLDEVLVDIRDTRDAEERIHSALGQRIVCKPRYQGSALGVTLLPNGGDVKDAMHEGFRYDDQLIVEPFVIGREVTVGILDLQGQDPVALPVTEILVPENQWFDYYHRYTPGKSQHVIPAQIDPRNLPR